MDDKAKADMLKMKRKMEKLMAKTFGKRCKTTDKEDFPETDYSDPNNGRCFTCLSYEKLDAFIADLWKDLIDGT